MPNGKNRLPDKTEERGLLSKVKDLAPVLSLMLQLLEFLLKLLKAFR